MQNIITLKKMKKLNLKKNSKKIKNYLALKQLTFITHYSNEAISKKKWII